MKAIVLAAGKGTRLQSEKFNLPKVLRKANDVPLLQYVLDSLDFIPPEDICIVVGYKKEKVIDLIGHDYGYVSQDQQLGTGHAVMVTEEYFKDYDGPILVVYGDMPLYKKETYEKLIKQHIDNNAKCTILTAVEDSPLQYGRIIRDENGEIMNIVETKDCNDEQLQIKELNVGVYVFESTFLFEQLKNINNHNAQKEYYLTDIPKIMVGNGDKIYSYTLYNSDEIFGVNTLEELHACEAILKKRRD